VARPPVFAPSRRSVTAKAPRSPWAWGVSGLLAGVLPAVVAFAPAQWLASAVTRGTQGQVQLLQARGTVWSGSAQVVLTGGAGSQDRAALPSRVQWQLSLGWGNLHVQARTDCCTPQGPLQAHITPRWSQVHIAVADGQSQWPSALLTGLGTPWNTLQPSGTLAIQTQGLGFTLQGGRVAVAGQAQLDAIDMASRLSTLRPMGSYRLVLQGGDAPTLALTTTQGDLQLSGSGQWVGQRLRFTGEATATPEREAALANLLNLIGRRQGARSLITVG